MASQMGNMTPVYDGMGNLMGYVSNTPPQISKVVISNGTISMFDRNGIMMGSSQLEQTMLTKLGFSPINGKTPIVNGDAIVSGTTPAIGQLFNTNSDVVGGGSTTTSSSCVKVRFYLNGIRIETQANTCVLLADIWKLCCDDSSRVKIGTVKLATAESTVIYENCPFGTRKRTVRHFRRYPNPTGYGVDLASQLDWFSINSPNLIGEVTVASNWAIDCGETPTTFGNLIDGIIERIKKLPTDRSYLNPADYLQNPEILKEYLTYQTIAGSDILSSIILPNGTGPCNSEIEPCPTPPDKGPDDPKKEIECHTVNSKEYARYLNGQYSTAFYNIEDEIVKTKYVTETITYETGNRVNLGPDGPCETGIFETKITTQTNNFSILRVCYEVQRDTAGNIIRVWNVIIEPAGGTFTDGETQETRQTYLLESSREYDPNAECCSNLQWPQDYKGDMPLVNGGSTGNGGTTPATGGPTPPLGGFGNVGTMARTNLQSTVGGSPSVAKMPPKNVSYLNYRFDNVKTVRLTSCGCEEVTIADIWCYYNNEPIALWAPASVDDPRTYITPIQTIPDVNCIDTRVYHPFDRKRDIFYTYKKDKTVGLFNGQQDLDCYLTSSYTSSVSNEFYYAVTDCIDCNNEPYFAVAYGHIEGSGSQYLNGDASLKKTPTDAIYSQYQLLCNDNELGTSANTLPTKFTFSSASTAVESDDVYVINFYRNGLSDKLDPGNFQINLAHLSGSFYTNNTHTGSNVKVGSPFVMQLIDDSGDFSQAYSCHGDSMTSYSLVSGSLANGKYESADTNSYGRVYPTLGVIILHPKRLNELLGFNTVTGSNIAGDNAFKLFTAISGAAAPTSGRTDVYKLTARSIKYKTTHNYSIRVYGDQANFSSNPTFVSGSKNRIFDKCLIGNPNTYITSVGLYNENLELLAVAKLTKPMRKNFDTDLLIKIRLNW